MIQKTHPADTNGNFQITMTDLLDCASEWLSGGNAMPGVVQEMEKPYLLRAATILISGQDGTYCDEGGDGPHKWRPA